MFVNPMPPALVEELLAKDLVIVPELNYLGQMALVLRSMGIKAEAITQYTGLPFKVGELSERIKERMGSAGGGGNGRSKNGSKQRNGAKQKPKALKA